MVTVVKPSAKPRRTRLLAKGRKLNNKKRGRPKKATPAAEKKNKKNQSALDLLHAKTLSAAPPQGQSANTHTICCRYYFLNRTFTDVTNDNITVRTDAYRPPQSPFYQLPPKVQHYTPSQLLLSPTPPGLEKLLGKLMKTMIDVLTVMLKKPHAPYQIYT